MNNIRLYGCMFISPKIFCVSHGISFSFFLNGLQKNIYLTCKANTAAMHRSGGIPSKVTFHQAEESDRLGMARLCKNQGWDTEDHQHLASVLPPAVHVARCGAKVVGLYFYII